MQRCIGTVFLVFISMLAMPVLAFDLGGQIDIGKTKTGEQPDLQEVVIFFRPRTPVPPPQALPDPILVRMFGKVFDPTVIAVPVGSTIRFENFDPILHNVFSTSNNAKFDLGFYGAGSGREVAFEKPGLIRVFCNVHHGMVASVLVLDTPYFTKPDKDGAFLLREVTEPSGTLYIWHPQAGSRSIKVKNLEQPVTVTLNFIKRRIPRHLNKHGKPYLKRNRRGY